MLWFWASLLAAVLWGFSYASTDPLLKSGISSFTLMAFYTWVAAPLFTLLAWQDKSLGHGIALVKGNPKIIFWILGMVTCYFFGNALIYWAIKQKNATSVSLIEISYPLFVALFSWIVFGQNHLTLSTLAGGALILSGVTVIYAFR